MSLPKLTLPVTSQGYSAAQGIATISVELDGGASRFRQDKLGATHRLDVEWLCTPYNYNYLLAFYRTATAQGSLPFLIDLRIDTSGVSEYTAYFVPGSFVLKQQAGLTYLVGAKLEVKPILPGTSADNTVITAGPQL